MQQQIEQTALQRDPLRVPLRLAQRPGGMLIAFGLALAMNLRGQAGTAMVAVGLAVMVPMANVLSVYVLARHAQGRNLGIGPTVSMLARNPRLSRPPPHWKRVPPVRCPLKLSSAGDRPVRRRWSHGPP
jgi:hypothetical protein